MREAKTKLCWVVMVPFMRHGSWQTSGTLADSLGTLYCLTSLHGLGTLRHLNSASVAGLNAKVYTAVDKAPYSTPNSGLL